MTTDEIRAYADAATARSEDLQRQAAACLDRFNKAMARTEAIDRHIAKQRRR